MGKILDARGLCDRLETDIKAYIWDNDLSSLCLASVAVGGDYSVRKYQSSQKQVAERLGVKYISVDLEQDTAFEEFKSKIRELNHDESVTGIIINKPFPQGWKDEDVFSLLSEDKDVEGMHTANFGKFFTLSSKTIEDLCSRQFCDLRIPPTVMSVLKLLYETGIDDVYGKRVTLVGFSSIIGKPLSLLLANAFATVSITHIATFEVEDLPDYVKNADIVISAVGKPHVIKGEWIKKGSVVIDVGTADKDGELTGDVEFDEAKEKASFITPVPGGVGRLTTLCLFNNLAVMAVKRRKM